jgi:hypothetical protein
MNPFSGRFLMPYEHRHGDICKDLRGAQLERQVHAVGKALTFRLVFLSPTFLDQVRIFGQLGMSVRVECIAVCSRKTNRDHQASSARRMNRYCPQPLRPSLPGSTQTSSARPLDISRFS